MIARIWHGRTPIAKADAYLAFLEARAIPDYRAVPGNLGAYVAHHVEGGAAHFVTLSLWDSIAAIEAFAGADVLKAKYYPEDAEFLLEYEPEVRHVTIRPVQESDAAVVAALATQLGYPSTEEMIRARMDTLAARGATAILVAELDGDVAAWIAVREEMSLESGPFAEIAGLVVDEARRGQRIGESLVAAAEAWAKGRGHTRMRVRSNVLRLRAHLFYERLGYTATKRQVAFDKAL